MKQLVVILESALPVFAAVFIGVLCRSRGLLTRENIDGLKKIVVNITLPAVLLAAFASADYTLSTLVVPALMFILCLIALGGGFAVCRLFKISGKQMPYLASGFEAGMLGYALFVILFPNVSTSHFAILDLGQTLFVFTLFKIMLSGQRSIKKVGKDMITSPILWAIFLGIVISVSGLGEKMTEWGVSGIFEKVTDFAGAPTGMVILITVGYDLVLREIPWKKTFGLVAMRFGIMAVLYGIIHFLNRTVLNGVIFEGAVILMLILPPPYVIPVFADEPSERIQISSALSVMTLLTVILFAAYAVALAI